jgi:hypothetical protein
MWHTSRVFQNSQRKNGKIEKSNVKKANKGHPLLCLSKVTRRSFVDFQLADRQNVKIQIVGILGNVHIHQQLP